MPWTRVLSGLVLSLLMYEAHGQENEAPSVELLEYLADMVADEDGWVGPGDLQQFVMPERAIIIDEPPGERAEESHGEDDDDK